MIPVQNFYLQIEALEKIIFGADLSSSAHIDNERKDILILGKGQTHGLDDTTSTVDAKYPIMITQSGKRFVLSWNYNGSSSFLFVYATDIYQFKAKDSKTKDYALRLLNISNDFAINNIKIKIKRNYKHFFLLISILLVLMRFWISINIWMKRTWSKKHDLKRTWSEKNMI